MDERLKQIIHGACAERDAPIEAIERMSGKVQVLVICGPQFDIH